MQLEMKAAIHLDTKVRILVVDDHRDSARLLQRWLSKLGYGVVTAANTQDARETLSYERFDVMISDMWFPDGDGCALARWALSKCSRLTCIALTGTATQAQIDRFLKGGFHYHFLKPVSLSALETTIKQLNRAPR